MGSEVCKAVVDADDMDLVAMVDTGDWLFNVSDADAQVIVDFTTPDVVLDNLRWCIDQGVSAVVGTSGFTPDKLDTLRDWLGKDPQVGIIVVPNFALGAVLMMRFAELAARYFESVEIIELHHAGKLDAPSGTARRTAELIAGARTAGGLGAAPDSTTSAVVGARGAVVNGVPVHSVRLSGLVAHQEVLLGTVGETLTIRHDSYDRLSFMPGVLLALRAVLSRPGLTVGLEHLLDL
jgi:4-hydroxy-tetrahydrodipicolinate reductase